MPKYLSSDNDPLYRFHQWQANLRVLEVTEIKSIPYVLLSHPFTERLIGTLRREYLDRMLFWTTADLETSCSISGPTSTTIARIPHWKGERRIRRCHDQSQTSARFDGNLIVVTYIRHQWLRNFPRLSIAAYPVNLGKTSKLRTKPSAVAFLVAARFADPIVSLPPYQFAKNKFLWRIGKELHGKKEKLLLDPAINDLIQSAGDRQAWLSFLLRRPRGMKSARGLENLPGARPVLLA